MNPASVMAMEDTFDEVKNLVYDQVWKLKKELPRLNVEDALSTALFAYVEAYHMYKPEKGPFQAWIIFKVRMKLKKHVHLVIKDNDRKPLNYSEHLDTVPKGGDPTFDIKVFLRALSKDARKVVKCVVQFPPIDLLVLLKGHGDGDPNRYRAAIKNFLRECEWSRDRIQRAFDEVQSALQMRIGHG